MPKLLGTSSPLRAPPLVSSPSRPCGRVRLRLRQRGADVSTFECERYECSCGEVLELATAVAGEEGPSEGSVSLCAGCGQALCFNAALRLEPISWDELETKLASQPLELALLRVARAFAIEGRIDRELANAKRGRLS